MGVSLERVQFKFASIIGELCSEPDVLSQFAVWLDLRLAEYKLKGAISLDCSGEEPDPTWLKGLSKSKKGRATIPSDKRPSGHGQPRVRGMAPHRPQQSREASSSYSMIGPNAKVVERLSPDFLIVKDEPDDDYPDEGNSAAIKRKQKRAPEVYTGDEWHLSATPAKQKCIISTTDVPSNQSFIPQESDSKGGNSDSAPVASGSNPVADETHGSVDTEDQANDDAAVYDIHYTGEGDWALQSGWSGDSAESEERRREQLPSEAKLYQSEHTCQKDLSAFTMDIPFTYNRYTARNFEIRRCIPNSDKLSRARISNIVSAVRTFEHWLWKTFTAESRVMSEIRPDELDKYLVKFFEELKMPNGKDYSLPSVKSLRSNLDFYLKFSGYPAFISSSEVFANSRRAFQNKCRLIKSYRDTLYQL